MPYPSKVVTLFDQTSAANTPSNSGSLDTSDFEGLLVEVLFSAAASGAPIIALVDVDTTVQLVNDGVNVAATSAVVGYGPGGGLFGDNAAGYAAAPGAILPSTTRVTVGAAGVGITARLIVKGRRNFRGSVPNTNTLNGITPRALD